MWKNVFCSDETELQHCEKIIPTVKHGGVTCLLFPSN